MRSAHWLTDNKSVELPSRCVFFDCETKQRRVEDGADINLFNRYGTVEAHLWFGYGAYVRRDNGFNWTDPEWLHFESAYSFWDWVVGLTPEATKMYVFAHNAGFDMSASKCFSYFYNAEVIDGDRVYRWQVDSAILDDPPTAVTFALKDNYNCKRHKGESDSDDCKCTMVKSIIVLDTLNWFRVPLAVLGKSIGVEKLDMPAYSESYECWKEYCKRDVLVILRAILAFMKFIFDEGLGNFARTLPSQALASYKHRFKADSGIYIDSNEKALELSRDSYHGGRVEIFKQGKLDTEITCVDINSMYPYVMKQQDFPMRFVSHARSMTITELGLVAKRYAVVARVKVNTDLPIYSYQYGGKLVFPIGSFTVTLCTPEILEAVKRNHIIEIYDVCLYQKEPIFRDYIEYFWKVRRDAKDQGDTARDVMSKLFMNSLYGKFGQTGRVFNEVKQIESGDVKRWSEWDADTGSKRTFRMIYGLIQEEQIEGESLDSLPAISAHVTAYGRMMLWKLIETAGRDHVFYCDTDSLFVDNTGLANLQAFMDDSRLGALKAEWKSSDVILRGNKDYSTGKYTKIKGIRKNAMKLIWTGEVAPIVTINPRDFVYNVFVQERFHGLVSKIRAGDMDTQLITMITKIYNRRYNKGTVTKSGKVIPLIFKDDVLIGG